MKAFEHGTWHAWEATKGILLSDESTKNLRQFADTDSAINWLFLSGNKNASRALHAHIKAGQK